jgi:hypothetical protein
MVVEMTAATSHKWWKLASSWPKVPNMTTEYAMTYLVALSRLGTRWPVS